MNPPANFDLGYDAIAPRITDAADQERWDEACDVLVVGMGIAGVSAALATSETGGGRSVLVIDRFNGGGSSSLSGGVVYAGGGTKVQREAGVDDPTEAMLAYLVEETGGAVSTETLRRFCTTSPEMIEWLEGHGVRFSSKVAPRKASYPTRDGYLYLSGNETVQVYADHIPAAPRGHRVVAAPNLSERFLYRGGASLMMTLIRALRAAPGVREILHCRVDRLVVDKAGRVVGVDVYQIPVGFNAWRHGKLQRISSHIALGDSKLAKWAWRKAASIEKRHARRRTITVRERTILAAGGFMRNRAMVQHHAATYLDATPLGAQGDVGSGIRLGQGVGGVTAYMDSVSAWRFINPPYVWMRGIMISRRGERLTNEEQYGARLGAALFEKAEGRGWLILDSKIVEDGERELKLPETWIFQRMIARAMLKNGKKAVTVADLEKQLEITDGGLQKAVERYNQDIAASAPDEFGKSRDLCAPLLTGPFYAVDVSSDVAGSPILAISLGGLAIDENTGAVLGTDNKPIAGLFAAGRSAVGLCSKSYISGLSLADGIFSGRRAGSFICQ
ncbi:FAD-binding protein [Sphingosinicella soli]|uniref:3-oxo-5alpha-steroid 4-dehydrogenase n=1 Tax=Sphingosinicella soli TaxID=333708 RepID=A0A7W7B0X8_9SPHN|nr:FAD-binding protein [Sphingosinicella soli]MBB4631981.1 3-oxo-5alpha-steroid 4-dehydrogenase [Sphingosinicella soli]